MNNNSKKRKASLLQNMVRKKILKSFPHLKSYDVKTPLTGWSGPDIILSDVAKKLVGCNFETKNQNKMKTVYDWYKQASRNTKLRPVVVMKMNARDPLVVININDFFKLIS